MREEYWGSKIDIPDVPFENCLCGAEANELLKCKSCEKVGCAECLVKDGSRWLCNDCYEFLRSEGDLE